MLALSAFADRAMRHFSLSLQRTLLQQMPRMMRKPKSARSFRSAASNARLRIGSENENDSTCACLPPLRPPTSPRGIRFILPRRRLRTRVSILHDRDAVPVRIPAANNSPHRHNNISSTTAEVPEWHIQIEPRDRRQSRVAFATQCAPRRPSFWHAARPPPSLPLSLSLSLSLHVLCTISA